MKIDVFGKHIDVGEALREHVTGNLNAAFEKYAERPTGAVATFSKDRHEFRCECSVHLSTGMSAQASSKAATPYAAFDLAEERLAKQLRRYKRKLKNHHNLRASPVKQMAVPSFVIESDASTVEAPDQETNGSSNDDDLRPVIIAETETHVPTLSVGEAVLQMELNEDPVLMFRDEKTDSISVVYRRTDGNIGWINSEPAA